MIIRPLLLYATAVWSNTTKSNYKKLEVVQNKALRMISKEKPNITNNKIRKILNVPKLQDVIYKQSKDFYEKQIIKVESLRHIISINHETAPFKIRYKLPHQIHIS